MGILMIGKAHAVFNEAMVPFPPAEEVEVDVGRLWIALPLQGNKAPIPMGAPERHPQCRAKSGTVKVEMAGLWNEGRHGFGFGSRCR